MDRPIEQGVRRKRVAKQAGIGVSVAATAGILLLGVSSLMRPSVRRDRIATTRVDSGPIEATISATGTVVPEVEQVLSSPFDARIVRILKRPGAAIAKGEPILELDLSESKLALERQTQAVALKENEQSQKRLDLERTLSDLQGRLEIKKLELQNQAAVLERNRKLFADGLVSQEILRQSELDEARAGVEQRQLDESAKIARRATEAQIRGLELEMETLRKERQETERQLGLGTTRAERAGVLTWVVSEEGAAVRKGDPLARLADLGSFRVEAEASDVHASRIAAGMSARVDAGGKVLTGVVSRIHPTIQNGVMTLTIRLDDPASAALRSNLRVDVALVTGKKERALRLKKGAFTGGEGQTELFVLRGDEAVQTPVTLGVSSFDRYEVVSGLVEGDEVIVSDTSAIQYLKQVRVK